LRQARQTKSRGARRAEEPAPRAPRHGARQTALGACQRRREPPGRATPGLPAPITFWALPPDSFGTLSTLAYFLVLPPACPPFSCRCLPPGPPPRSPCPPLSRRPASPPPTPPRPPAGGGR